MPGSERPKYPQSTSTDSKAAREDPINLVIVGRETTLALTQGLNVGGVGTTFVDSQNKILAKNIKAIFKEESISSEFDPPLKLDNANVTSLLSQNTGSKGISINKLDVHLDANDLRGSIFNLQVSDIVVANAALSSFMKGANQKINELDINQNTQISLYRINIKDANGKLLLNYINDFLLGCQYWWQVDGITNWGYPQPPPASPVSK